VQTVDYETTLEDLVEFNVYHLRTSRSGVSMRSRGSFSAGLVGLFLGILLIMTTGNIMFAALGVGLSVLSVFIYQPIMIRTARQNSRRIIADGKNLGTIGWHRLILEEEGLREESEAGSRYTTYASLERVAETDEHVFVYLSAIDAHVIPRGRVSSGDLTAFVGALRGHLAQI
jgi:hypothetical protein